MNQVRAPAETPVTGVAQGSHLFLRLQRLAWLPVPAYITLITILYIILPPGLASSLAYDPPVLLFVLNIVFLFGVSCAVSATAMRAYIASGASNILLLGCGVLALGCGALAGGWVRPLGGNATVTIHNLGVLLGAMLFAAAAILTLLGPEPEQTAERRRLKLLSAFGGTLILIAIIIAATLQGIVPTFYAEEVGPTPIRQVVLSMAVVLFAMTSIYTMVLYFQTRRSILYWYSLALALTAVGLIGLTAMRAVGSPIGWAGRTAQYLGGVYFLIAALSAFREAQARGLTLEMSIDCLYRRSEVYYRHLVDTMSDAIISIDERKRVLLWNRGAEELLGYTWAEVAGGLISDLLMPEGHKEKLDDELQDLQHENREPFAAKKLEIEMRRKDGTLFPSDTSLSMRRIGSGWIATLGIRDVTRRKQAEESLTQRNQELATISRVITATATQLDWQTILNRTLQGALEITGLEGGTLCLVNHRDGVLELASAINASEEVIRDLRTKDTRIGECLCGMVAKAGDPLILWDNASGSKFATREALRREAIRFHAAFPLMVKGQCIGVLCIFARSDKKPDPNKLHLLQDLCGGIGLILENARLYEAERKAREQVTHVLESITDGFVALDVEGRFIYINQKARDLLNFSTQDLMGKNIWSLLPEPLGSQLHSSCEKAMAEQRPVRLEEYHVEWNRWLDTRIYPFREGLAFYFNDITENKRMEEALRESEEKYRTLVEQSLQGTFVVQDMHIVFCNQTFANMGGWTIPEVLSWSTEKVINMVHLDDQKRVWGRFRERLEGKQLPLTNNQLRAPRKDGSIAWIEYDARRINYGGRPAMLISVVDITQRREAEKALRESEQRYRQLAESAQDSIFIIDKEGQVQYVNSSAAKEFRCHPDQLRGKSVMDLFPPDIAARHLDHIRKVIQTGQGLSNSETKVIFPGREAWLNTSLAPLGAESGEVSQVLGISRDVTELKLSEEALRKSETRYRQISEENARLLDQARQDAQTKTILLREVNHRVKNNLASIIGLIQAQERFRKKNGSPEFRSMFRDLASRVQGLAMAHNLLSAAGWSSIKLTDLANEVIHSTLQILPSDQHVSVHVSPSSIQVTPDQANTLALVINELATNTIKHGRGGEQPPSISVRIDENDGQILFEFQDNGPGYPESVLDEKHYHVGLHLVKNLVLRDLRGQVTLCNEHGALTRMQFGKRRS